MSNGHTQLKEEQPVGNEVVLRDINPKTITSAVEDERTGTPMNQTLDRIWNSINNKLSRVVNSVNGRTGVVTLTAKDVGLGNVDNVKQYSASNPPPYPVTSVNGQTGAVTIESGGSSIPVQADTPISQKVGDLWFKVV